MLPLEPKTEYKNFDLVEGDLSKLTIKKSIKDNCYITDGVNNYGGFILSKLKDTQTVCDVVFYQSSTDGRYIPRLTFSKIQPSKDRVKDATNPEKVRISFSDKSEGVYEFWKLIGFLSKFKELVDLGDFEDAYSVIGSDDVVLHLQDLKESDRIQEIVGYVQRTGVRIDDLVGAALSTKRNETLVVFSKLLNEDGAVEAYREEYNSEIKGSGEEAVWHHFLKTNQWLLGINLDVRFIKDFTDEVSVGNPDTENQGNPKVDMMGISDYTVLVEIKTSHTKIFTETKTSEARAGTWSFTTQFIEGFSQCLAQKFGWDNESSGKKLVKDSEVLSQEEHRTLDPKTIYIIGNKSKEIPQTSMEVDVILKRDTFERFRRNNRNVEIITYDELYERANFIVNGS